MHLDKASELARAKRDLPYLEQREVHLSDEPNDVVCSFRFMKLIERRMQTDKDFRTKWLARSDYYKSGKGYRQTPTELIGLDDSVAARFHAKLMRPAVPGEEHHVRGMGLFNCDDVEVCCR